VALAELAAARRRLVVPAALVEQEAPVAACRS